MPRQSLQQKSSASDLLTGTMFHGKHIAKVTRGKGTSRTLHFRGKGKEVVDRATIHELAKLQGLLQYRTRYLAARGPEKRRMLAKSTKRQQVLLRNYLARQEGNIAALPAGQQAAARRGLQRVRKRAHRLGSPLIGQTPASSIVNPRTSAFRVAKEAGVAFKTVRRKGRTYVIPVQ